MTAYGLCALYPCETLRMRHNSFIIRANRGKCSVTRTPGRAVGMVANSPRISGGASGFGSKLSMCDGPP
jgi:hypothetical protein